MKRERTQIYLIQETKLKGNENITINNCTFFLHGNDERERIAGVGIVFGKKATTAWKEMGSPEPTKITCAGAGRIIGMPIHFKDKYKRLTKFYLISAHLPHSDTTTYPDEVYEDCIDKICNLIREICSNNNTIPIIGGDFNARIGTHHQNGSKAEKCIGP